jgi:hypothetical protein
MVGFHCADLGENLQILALVRPKSVAEIKLRAFDRLNEFWPKRNTCAVVLFSTKKAEIHLKKIDTRNFIPTTGFGKISTNFTKI